MGYSVFLKALTFSNYRKETKMEKGGLRWRNRHFWLYVTELYYYKEKEGFAGDFCTAVGVRIRFSAPLCEKG